MTTPAAFVGLRGAFFRDRHDRRIIADGLSGGGSAADLGDDGEGVARAHR
jgi:hypothetical protein